MVSGVINVEFARTIVETSTTDNESADGATEQPVTDRCKFSLLMDRTLRRNTIATDHGAKIALTIVLDALGLDTSCAFFGRFSQSHSVTRSRARDGMN